MSFDVYVQFFAAGGPAGVALPMIRAAFPVPIEVVDDDYWKLHFGEEQWTDLFLQPLPHDGERMHSLSFHRPVDDARLWDGIFELLGESGAVFHFPGEAPPRVRDAASLEQLPEAFRATIPITDADALRRCVAEG